jgi:DNA-binding XRE family transcriptional regulator
MAAMVTSQDLKRARQRLDETQEQFAKRFGVDRSTYTAWEGGALPKAGTGPMLIEIVLAELAVQAAAE